MHFSRKYFHVAVYACSDVRTFADRVQIELEGHSDKIDTSKVSGGAKINGLFYNKFCERLSLVRILIKIDTLHLKSFGGNSTCTCKFKFDLYVALCLSI